MFQAFLALLPLALPFPRPVPAAPPCAALPDAAATLAAELRARDVERGVNALRRAPPAEPGVLGVMVGALAEEREPVRAAAIDALGRSGDALAYAALRAYHARERARLAGDVDLCIELLRALGRFARADTIDVLIADLEEPCDARLLRARLFGLAGIRGRAAADGVFYLLSRLTPQEVERSRGDLELALVRTTGADFGTDFDRWRGFWAARAPSLRLPETPPPFTKQQAKAWKRYWGA